MTKKIKECEIKLDQAQKLTDDLKEEKERWSKEIDMLSIYCQFQARNGKLLGFLSSLVNNNIPHSKGISMKSFLGDPVKIQSLEHCSSSKDDSSIENFTIIDKARRWPLMIDP